MNTRSGKARLMVFGAALAAASITVHAGPLSPPAGPIAPTNKTLNEVEPRIAINQANTPGNAISLFTINKPGSYYLTGNISGVGGKHGILIAAPSVTLDLMGFELRGVLGSQDGIFISALGDDLVILNGNIQSWGGSGINGSSATRARFEGVSCNLNVGTGFRPPRESQVRNCSARNNGIDGFRSGAESQFIDCIATGNGSTGIFLGLRDAVRGCLVFSNQLNGIRVSRRCTVIGNTASGNTGAGILVALEDNVIDGNTMVTNTTGISVVIGGNLIIRNSASGNSTNYSIVAGNQFGPLGSAATTSSAWANFNF